MLTKLAVVTDRRISRKMSPYKWVYGNVPLEGLFHYSVIDFDDLGKYDIRDALVLIDEATLEVDNRDYKSFKFHTKQFFLLHRHYNVDVCLFTQQWDAVDKKIRVITDKVFYMYKPRFLKRWFSRMYRVPYGIIIPDAKKSDSEKLGEIVQGYCKPNFLVRLFSPWLLRSRYYKYFDSWQAPKLPPLSYKGFQNLERNEKK